MGISIETLAAAKKFTSETVLGGGAVVGKNVTISSIVPIDGGNKVTFSYTLDNGTVKTSTMDVMDGIDGLPGKDGKDGLNGKDGSDGIGISKIEKIRTVDLVDTYRITFTDSSTFDYEVTNGKDGQGGGTADVPIEKIKVNGELQTPVNKVVDITVPSIEGLTKDADLSTVAKSGSYEDLINKPTIPDAYDDTVLSGRVDDVETSIGDMSLIEVKSVSDLVSAINALYNAFMSSITYADKKLTITYRNGGTVDIDMSAIITDTNIGELSNIDDTGVADKQVLSYDAATNKYIPTTIDTAGVLADAKKYTDDEIAKINNADAMAVDEKPIYSNGTITYKKGGVESTITDGDFWFFYTVDDMAYQTIWIDGVEFTTSVDGSVDFKDFVSKTNDLVSTYTGEETDKTKVATIASLDALYAIISTALGKKVNTTDIVDSLVSDATDKPLSAAQGKALDGKKVDKVDGMALSSNDYTDEEKSLVATIEDKVDKTSIATALDDTATDEQVTSALLAKTELEKKVDKASIATTLSSGSTNDEVVGAKLAYDELQKAELATKEQFGTASGESISVNDSVDGKIRDLKLYGKSEQKQYSGKNLLNSTLETTEKNGVTCTANGDGTYTLNGMMTGSGFTEFMLCSFSYENGKMYKICGCPDNGNWGKYGIISSNSDSIIGVDAHDYGNGLVFTPKQSGTLEIQIRIWAGVNADKLTFKPMLVDATLYPDTTYDDFEPYTGGIPSPNPNYPQEIKSVMNPVVKVVGKNLLNPTLDTTTKNGVTCTKNDDGTYTLNGTASANTFININTKISVETGKTYNLIGFNGDINIGDERGIQYVVRDAYDADIQFTRVGGVFVPNVSNILIYVFVWKGITLNNVLFKPMLTTDLNATYDDFVPYQGEQTATLPYTLNAIPVESGGNVTIDGQQYIADYVDFEKKQLVRMVKKKDLGEFYWSYIGNEVPELKYFNATILDSFMPTESHPIGEGFCDLYSVEKNNIPKPDLANNKVAIGWFNLSSTRCPLEIRDDDYTDAIDFKNAVKGHYVYYRLATPTTIDLTDEEVQAFKELSTYYPTTNVFVTSDQLNGYADVKYPTTDVSGIVSNHDVEIEKLKKADTENFNALEQDIENQFSTASGDYITVNDSVDGNIIELGVKGNSFQNTYSGKNLFDCATMFPASAQVSGITLTNNGDGTFTLSGTATANAQIFKDFTHEQTVAFFKNGAGIYTLSTQELPTTGNVFQCTLVKYNGTDSDYTWRSSPQGKAKSYNITQEMLDNELFFISFMFYIHSGNTINQTFTPQVEFGSSATEYEAYVGGIPSPNPSYPQTINSVGDDGSLVIKSENKNILNIPDGSKDSNGITTTALNGRITCSGTSTAKFADVIHNISILFQSNNVYTFSIGEPIDCDISIKLHDSNGTALSDKRILKGSTSITFTAPENVARATFYIAGFESGTAISISDLYLQVEKGDVATLPVLHEESTATIPLSEPLRAIGDVKDEITYQDGKWGVLRRIKEINLTDLAWELVNNDTYQYWRYSVNDGKEASSYNNTANILAEKYMASSWYNTVRLNSATNAIAYGFNANNTSAKIVAVHNGSTTESPTGKFLYELITPTFEPFADQTLPYLSTYDGVTNISNDDALSAEMTVKYPTTDASGVGSRNESRIVDIEGTVGSTDISDIGDGTITNAISMMSSKLGGLTFSASGTTLSITDGTNTWTLEANS